MGILGLGGILYRDALARILPVGGAFGEP